MTEGKIQASWAKSATIALSVSYASNPGPRSRWYVNTEAMKRILSTKISGKNDSQGVELFRSEMDNAFLVATVVASEPARLPVGYTTDVRYFPADKTIFMDESVGHCPTPFRLEYWFKTVKGPKDSAARVHRDEAILNPGRQMTSYVVIGGVALPVTGADWTDHDRHKIELPWNFAGTITWGENVYVSRHSEPPLSSSNTKIATETPVPQCLDDLPPKLLAELKIDRMYRDLGKLAVATLGGLDIEPAIMYHVTESSLWATDAPCILDSRSSKVLAAFCDARKRLVDYLGQQRVEVATLKLPKVDADRPEFKKTNQTDNGSLT